MSERVTNADVIPIIQSWVRELAPMLVWDIGCGSIKDKWGAEHDVYTMCLADIPVVIGVDAWAKHVQQRNAVNVNPGHTFVHATFAEWNEMSGHHVPELIVAHHVLEHLSLDEMTQTVLQMEGWVSKAMIVGGPIGYTDNEAAVIASGNPYEEHKTALDPGWFGVRGYEIHTIADKVWVGMRRYDTEHSE